MLDFNNINKSYTNVTKSNLVLDDASIKINTSKINLIIGTSGIGKSTLLNIMGCLIRPDSGKLLYGNKKYDLQKDNMNDFRISSYSYLFQDYNLLPEFNVYDNLLLPSYINKLNINNTKASIEKYMKYIDIKHLKHVFPNTLSHCEKQRVAMLRSLLGGKKIVLADEPTGNLDEINTKLLLELIVNINKEFGYTFIITSHDMNFEKIASNIFKIENKKINKIK